MEPEYLLDSNIVIAALNGSIPAPGLKAVAAMIDRTPLISVISQIELLRFNDTPENEQVLSDFVENSIIYPLDPEVVERTIAICKQRRIKLPDAIIAATALVEGLTLVTRNVDDFKNIPGLLLFDPWNSE
ncbi:MAG: type II toxin-antitoxin system VapC family toxin [Treponema sp.]|nr:type II toxin-antitoxin system VapC family toxin [Treponema sp.]